MFIDLNSLSFSRRVVFVSVYNNVRIQRLILTLEDVKKQKNKKKIKIGQYPNGRGRMVRTEL